MAKSNQNMPPDLVEKVPLVPVSARRPSENDDEDDIRPTVNRPYPGVDDGFFPASENDPEISQRAGPDGKSDKPEPEDGATKPPLFIDIPPGIFDKPHDPETGTQIPDLDGPILPDVNVYQHKKTLAQGMMDLALFSANANQLRYVLESSSKHPYFYPSVVLISFSLLMQVAVGVGLVWNATYNVKDEKEICIANKVNNFTVIGIFLVTVVNVFISAFGVATVGPSV